MMANPTLLDEGLRGYWEDPAFVIGVALLVVGVLALLAFARPGRATEGGADALGMERAARLSWFVAGLAGAALLVAGVVFHPAYALGGGFILLVAAAKLLMP